MMSLTEKVAYLKGLAAGLDLKEDKESTKMFNAIMDVLEDMALTVSDLDDELDLIVDQLDAVDEDLESLEDVFYDELDDCDCDCCCEDDDEMFEVDCPCCGETVFFDESALDEEFVNCPACGEKLEFDFDECCCDDDCDCGCSDDK